MGGDAACDPLTGQPDPPDPWSEELALIYRMALVRYVGEFGQPGLPRIPPLPAIDPDRQTES